jgi:uncharacterized cupredoxin-like copper-binding protein
MPIPRLATMTGSAGLLVTALIVAACSSGAGSSSPSAATATPVTSTTPSFTPGTKAQPRIVAITATDSLMFMPMDIPVAKGETVTFQIKNTGTIEHEFMVGPMADAFGDKEGTPEIAGITGGTTKSVTVTFDGPGPYAFACHAPGHFEAGMKGTITLVGS